MSVAGSTACYPRGAESSAFRRRIAPNEPGRRRALSLAFPLAFVRARRRSRSRGGPRGGRTRGAHIWKICSWLYETCKDLGAIIATAHEHSYQRTRTLTSMKDQVVDASCPDPNAVCVATGSPGKSFVFVSGLVVQSVRRALGRSRGARARRIRDRVGKTDSYTGISLESDAVVGPPPIVHEHLR